MHTAIDIDASLRRFWELEEVNQEFHGKPEDNEVEQHFVKTHTRDSKGRRTSVQKLQGTVFGYFTGSANKIHGCRALPKERPQSAFTVRAIYAWVSSVGPHARTIARRNWQKAELLLATSSCNYPKITGRIWRLIQGHEWTVLKRSSAHWTQHSTKPFLDLHAF